MRHTLSILLAIFLVSCGSTPKQITDAQIQHIENATIKKMVKMNILELKFADEIARMEQDRKNKQNAELKNSVFATATDDGTLIGGYLLSNLVGSGASLTDFFSIGNLLLSGIPDKKNVAQHHRTYGFIEIPQNCKYLSLRVRVLRHLALRIRCLAFIFLNF